MTKWASSFSDGMTAPLRKLNALAPLGEDGNSALSDLCSKTRAVAPQQVIALEGDEIGAPVLLVSGWAYSEHILPDGRRQVLSVSLPGDTIGLVRRPRPRSSSSFIALTEVRLADATALEASASSGRDSGLRLACLRSEAMENVLMLDQLVRLGRHSATERVVHFLLEMRARLQLIGHCDAMRHDMPVRQGMLADLLGLSPVHLNRTLRQLRRDRLVEFGGGSMILPDAQALIDMIGYKDPVERCMDFVRETTDRIVPIPFHAARPVRKIARPGLS